MSSSGFILSMIQSLRSNKNLIGKRMTLFTRDFEHIKKKKTLKAEKKLSKEEKIAIKRKFRAEQKRLNKKLTIGLVIIFIIVLVIIWWINANPSSLNIFKR